MTEIHKKMHPYPCLHCHPRTFIRMVQSLIERCLLLRMDRDQCVKALEEHARIQPLVTLTGIHSSAHHAVVERAVEGEQGLLSILFPVYVSKTTHKWAFSKGTKICKKKPATMEIIKH